MGQEKKQKETDEIRALLTGFGDFQDKIDLAEGRLEYLEYKSYSPSGSNLSGMPGGTRDGTSKQERDYIRKEEQKEKLEEMYAEESRRREEIEGLIECMKKPKEQTVIEMRYLDRTPWNAINAVLHGDEPDFDEETLRYLKRTFKIHGHALQSLARIYNEQKSASESRPS